jgi:hypothetical protein
MRCFGTTDDKTKFDAIFVEDLKQIKKGLVTSPETWQRNPSERQPGGDQPQDMKTAEEKSRKLYESDTDMFLLLKTAVLVSSIRWVVFYCKAHPGSAEQGKPQTSQNLDPVLTVRYVRLYVLVLPVCVCVCDFLMHVSGFLSSKHLIPLVDPQPRF